MQTAAVSLALLLALGLIAGCGYDGGSLALLSGDGTYVASYTRAAHQ